MRHIQHALANPNRGVPIQKISVLITEFVYLLVVNNKQNSSHGVDSIIFGIAYPIILV